MNSITFSILFFILQVFDILTTLIAIKYFSASEANPIMNMIVRMPLLFVAVKLSVTLLIIYIASKIPSYKNMNQYGYYILIIMMSFVVGSNLFQIIRGV